jgi:DNA repair exonuclease SbcCD ATPase subunit
VSRIKVLSIKLAGDRGRLEAAREDLADKEMRLEAARAASVLHADECEILKRMGEILRDRTKRRVEALGTQALVSVFGREDYALKLDMDLKRGQMTCTPMIVSKFRGKDIEVPVQDAHGGGLVNVVSFVLRVIVIVLTRPRLERWLLADEPFPNLSSGYQHRVGQLVRHLSEMCGMQFAIVTQHEEFAEEVDRVFEVWKEDGVTKLGVKED